MKKYSLLLLCILMLFMSGCGAGIAVGFGAPYFWGGPSIVVVGGHHHHW